MKKKSMIVALIAILMTLTVLVGSASAAAGKTLLKGETIVVTQRANLRTAKTPNAPVAVVPKGQVLKLVADSRRDADKTAWYKVTYNGKTGWISSSCVRYAPKPAKSAAIVTTKATNIRKSPAVNATILKPLKAGVQTVYLNAHYTDARGVIWYKVYNAGKIGWVSGRTAKPVALLQA